MRLAGGVEFAFPARSIGPGKHILIVSNLTAFRQAYGDAAAAQVLGEYRGQLGNSGDTFDLLASNRSIIQHVSYTTVGNANNDLFFGFFGIDTNPWVFQILYSITGIVDQVD